MQTICIILFAVLSAHSGQAQSATKNPSFTGIKFHGGFIIPHSQKIEPISFSKPLGAELTFGKIILNESGYKVIDQFSKFGLSLHFFDYRYPDVLGQSYNLSVIGEPVFNFDKSWYLSIRTGLGLSFLSQTYHAQNNPENKFFSSPLSFILFLQINAHYKLNKQWQVSLHASYPHISNGGIKQPNLGMNFPTFGLGAEYIFTDYSLPDYKKLTPKTHQARNHAETESFICAKNLDADETHEAKLIWLYGIQTRALRQITKHHELNIAAEWTVDNFAKERMKRAGISISRHELAVMAGYAYSFGQFAFRWQMAYYIFAPSETDNFYQRYSLNFRINKRWQIAGTLKANKHVADIFDFRIGFRF